MSHDADMVGPVIRTAVDADLPELQRVFAAASLSNPGDAPNLLARPEFLHFAGDGIAAGRTRVAVTGAPDDDRVLGFATLVVDDSGEAELEDLFVDPDHRRRGIARVLVADTAGAARTAGHPCLWVTGNPHALEFYRAVGFVEIGQTPTEFGPAPRLRLDLAAAS